MLPFQYISKLQAVLSWIGVYPLEVSFPRIFSYSHFVEIMPRRFVAMTMFLNLACFGQCSEISLVDSTCIPVIHNRRQNSMKVFRDLATKGKSTMGLYIGFNLHLLCNEKGEIISFVLTRANVNDRNKSVRDSLTDKVFGKLYADKGYISQSLFEHLWDDGVHSDWSESKHEAEAYANVRQDHAAQEEHHQVS